MFQCFWPNPPILPKPHIFPITHNEPTKGEKMFSMFEDFHPELGISLFGCDCIQAFSFLIFIKNNFLPQPI